MYPIHIGGKTALEVQGKAHFVKFQDHQIFVLGPQGFTISKWLRELENTPYEFIPVPSNLFETSVGLKEYDFGSIV